MRKGDGDRRTCYSFKGRYKRALHRYNRRMGKELIRVWLISGDAGELD